MKIKYIGSKKIKSISVELSKLSTLWKYKEYKPTKRFLGIIKSKEMKSGYYNAYGWYYETAESLVYADQSLFIKTNQPNENKLWEKARVFIDFKGDSSTAYFENDQDAIDFAEEISKKFNHIKINNK